MFVGEGSDPLLFLIIQFDDTVYGNADVTAPCTQDAGTNGSVIVLDIGRKYLRQHEAIESIRTLLSLRDGAFEGIPRGNVRRPIRYLPLPDVIDMRIVRQHMAALRRNRPGKVRIGKILFDL